MAGLISKTLLRHVTASASVSHRIKATPCIILPHRHRSSQASKPQLIKIDLGSSSSSPEYEVALKWFDDLVQRILIKKATPDWLPFVPGSSFWVPPRPSPSSTVHLIEKFTNELSDEESLSVATVQGWPCSKFLSKENESAYGGDAVVEVNSPEGMEVTVQVKVLTDTENIAHSEDEEG